MSDPRHPTHTVDEQLLLTAVAGAVDPGRLTQARRLMGLTKRAVADALGVSPAAVGQWEAGVTAPRPDHLDRLADMLEVAPGFFARDPRRPYTRLEVADANFRSLRSTSAAERARAVAFTEQVSELARALEAHVELPYVDLPGFAGGEVQPGAYADDPAAAAQELRRAWGLAQGPVPHLVLTIEQHGIIVTLVRFAASNADTAKVDAFSTSRLPRPVVVLTPDRAKDVYRHRFTAAHELGHLVMHPDAGLGDPTHERQADAFAAEFLTPRAEINDLLPKRLDLPALDSLSRDWGVSMDSLLYRCHELGRISEATYRRGFQRLNQLRELELYNAEPAAMYPGEVPQMLSQALRLAEAHQRTSVQDLANVLRVPLPRVRHLLGEPDQRPRLRLV